MEPVFFEVHGDCFRVNGHKLENGKFPNGHGEFFYHDNGKTLEDFTLDCGDSTQIPRHLKCNRIPVFFFQPVRFNFLWICLALVNYSLASEDKESHEDFHCLLHLAEAEVQDEILVRSALGLQRKSCADSLKILNKKKCIIYILALSNADKFIFSSDRGTSKSLKETWSRLKEPVEYGIQRDIYVWKQGYKVAEEVADIYIARALYGRSSVLERI